MSWRAALLWFLLLVPAFNTLTVLLLPQAVNALVMHRISSGRGVNVALPAPRADDRARTVVRPSPDLLYTACVFDLREGPLHITAPVPSSYLSVSGFAADTSNFFALNDSQLLPDAEGQKRIDVVLVEDETSPLPPPVGAGTQRIVAPSRRGLVLFRLLILNDAALPVLQQQYQSLQRCETL